MGIHKFQQQQKYTCFPSVNVGAVRMYPSFISTKQTPRTSFDGWLQVANRRLHFTASSMGVSVSVCVCVCEFRWIHFRFFWEIFLDSCLFLGSADDDDDDDEAWVLFANLNKEYYRTKHKVFPINRWWRFHLINAQTNKSKSKANRNTNINIFMSCLWTSGLFLYGSFSTSAVFMRKQNRIV